MGEEKTLLQQIGEKERELNARLKDVAQESERRIAEARTIAAAQVAQADEAGKQEAAAYLAKERGMAASEAEAVKADGAREVGAIRARGEPNVPKAAAEIVRRVTLR